MLKEGCISLTDFDNMTRKRIFRIIELQADRLKEQQDYIENERKKQEREIRIKQRQKF